MIDIYKFFYRIIYTFSTIIKATYIGSYRTTISSFSAIS